MNYVEPTTAETVFTVIYFLGGIATLAYGAYSESKNRSGVPGAIVLLVAIIWPIAAIMIFCKILSDKFNKETEY